MQIPMSELSPIEPPWKYYGERDKFLRRGAYLKFIDLGAIPNSVYIVEFYNETFKEIRKEIIARLMLLDHFITRCIRQPDRYQQLKRLSDGTREDEFAPPGLIFNCGFQLYFD